MDEQIQEATELIETIYRHGTADDLERLKTLIEAFIEDLV